MPNTQVADYIGKPNLGYVIVAFPSTNLKVKLAKLLTDLSAELPNVLWTMPAEQLHVTLCEIIQPKDYSQDKDSLFNVFQNKYEDVVSSILADVSKLTVTFDTIEASSQAIIARASNSTQFNAIREKLMSSIQLPTETRNPPDITHSSIARYAKEINLEQVQDVVARHSIHIEEEITELKLVKTEIPPMQKYQALKTYSLVGK